MARILWDKSPNPPLYVSERLSVVDWELGEAIHAIKAGSNLSGSARIIIYDDGMVTDENGEQIGNIYDEI